MWSFNDIHENCMDNNYKRNSMFFKKHLMSSISQISIKNIRFVSKHILSHTTLFFEKQKHLE